MLPEGLNVALATNENGEIVIASLKRSSLGIKLNFETIGRQNSLVGTFGGSFMRTRK